MLYWLIIIPLYLVHAWYGTKWFDLKGYPAWTFYISCAILGIMNGVLQACIDGANGSIAAIIFTAVVCLNYILQVKHAK